jgi:hypothetical protein
VVFIVYRQVRPANNQGFAFRRSAAGKEIREDLRRTGHGLAWPVPPVMLFARLIIHTPQRMGIQWPGALRPTRHGSLLGQLLPDMA